MTATTTDSTPASPPAPWAHLPETEQDAIELAIAHALVAWIDEEAAKLRPMTQPQKGDAGELGSPASAHQPQ